MSDVLSKVIDSLRVSVEDAWEKAESERERRNKLLHYWPKLLPKLNYSPQQFYALVLENLQGQGLPGLKVNGVLLSQSGFLSSRRLYLQLKRERLVFEICGLPFGTNFFVSYRLFDRRRDARWYHYLLILAGLWLLAGPLWFRFGTVGGVVMLSGLICLVWSVMRLSAMDDTFGHLNDFMCDLPVMGRIYESLFRPETYYRQDTNAAYKEAVHQAVVQAARSIASEQGSQAFVTEASEPVLADLHRK